MAIIPTSQTCAKAIQVYQICGPQCAKSSTQSRNQAGQDLRDKSDTVQFSQEALDLLESFKQNQAKEASRETQTMQQKDSELEKNLKILELDKNASVEEIRKAYLHAIQQYHPDKHANLPPEFRQLAEARSKQLNELYSAVLKLKTSDMQKR